MNVIPQPRRPTRFALVWLLISAITIAIAIAGCADTNEPGPALARQVAAIEGACQTDQIIWLDRATLFLWGRRVHSYREREVLLELLEQLGADELVRRMTRSPEFVEHWIANLEDILHVNRTSRRANPACYRERAMNTQDPALAQFVRDNPPATARYGAYWTMTDLMVSAFALDDLSPVLSANLLLQMPTNRVEPGNKEREFAARRNMADVFQQVYLNRRLECLPCHNSVYSITDSTDPALDRAWPVAGAYEAPLFGSDAGMSPGKLDPIFRVYSVVAPYATTRDDGEWTHTIGDEGAPWGVAEACGRFVPPELIPLDERFEDAGFFVTDLGVTGSVWDVQSVLQTGFAQIRGTRVGEADVDGGSALAYLTSLSIAEAVWKKGVPGSLTISNTFPRNRSQRDMLTELTNTFVSSGFSLVELITAVATSEAFSPTSLECGGDESALPPLYDPWAGPTNGPGGAIRRLEGRVLLRTVASALEWERPPDWFEPFGIDITGTPHPTAQFQRDIGVFLTDTERGFYGTGFQTLLAWEEAYGRCENPFGEPAGDLIDRIVTEAPAELSVEDAIATLKDRLLTEPGIADADERAAFEALLGQPLDRPLRSHNDPRSLLRTACGALLATPQVLLTGDAPQPVEPTALVLSGTTKADYCNALSQKLGGFHCSPLGTPELSN